MNWALVIHTLHVEAEQKLAMAKKFMESGTAASSVVSLLTSYDILMSLARSFNAGYKDSRANSTDDAPKRD